MSSAVTTGWLETDALPDVVPEGPAARAWLRALCRLWMDMFWPMVVSPKYTSGHLWTQKSIPDEFKTVIG